MIEGFLGLLGQVVPVETELHAGLGNGMIIVQIGYRVGEDAYTAIGGIGHLLSLGGVLSSGLRLLLDFSRLGVDGLNSGLGAGIDFLDIAGILRGQVIKLVGLVNEGGRLLFDVVFAAASNSGGQAGGEANC